MAGDAGHAQGRRIQGQGTPESDWQRWDGLRRLEPIALAQLVPPGARVVVVAPHPDDEVLGCGGLLAMLAGAGRAIQVIGVTNGEASHPGSAAWPPPLLAATRRDERQAGLDCLGRDLPSIALAIPDGRVGDFERELAAAIGAALRPGDVVLATWRFDGHPDHEATGRIAARAAAATGCVCWEMPVWMWHWAAPDDSRVPWSRLRRLELAPAACRAKARAIAAHASQLAAVAQERREAVLPDWALARLLRPFETFLEPENLS